MKKFGKKSEKGFALTETVVFMIGFVILTAYAVDFFSIIHTGIVNTTAARTYLFETLQHRSNIGYLRQEDERWGSDFGKNAERYYSTMHFRFHAVRDEGQTSTGNNDGAMMPGRLITNASDSPRMMTDPNIKSNKNQTSLVWVKTGYGICLDSSCGR